MITPKFTSTVRRWGIASYLQSSSARLALKLGLRVTRIWEFFLDINAAHPPVPPDATLRRLSSADVAHLAKQPELRINRSAFDFAFDHGHMPLGLFLGDSLVNYGIFGKGAALGPDRTIVRLDPGLSYIWNTFTHPAFRGQRLMEVRVHLQRVQWADLA